MRSILAITLFGVSLLVNAQKIKKVSGEFEMRIESNLSENQALDEVIQKAKINALENEFGTRVGMMNQTRMENANGQTNTSFSSISNSLVKGVWLKDLAEPIIQKFDQNGERWIKAKVVGKARSLENAGISFQAETLKCANVNCKSQEFGQYDDLIFYFRSPEDGFLSVYLDDKNKSYLVLPYKNMAGGSIPIEADKEYFFFKADDKYNYFDQELTDIDEYTLYTNYTYEVNLLYVFFSKQPFSKPILDDNGDLVPKSTSSSLFNNWLAEIMSYEHMYMEVIDINISD